MSKWFKFNDREPENINHWPERIFYDTDFNLVTFDEDSGTFLDGAPESYAEIVFGEHTVQFVHD